KAASPPPGEGVLLLDSHGSHRTPRVMRGPSEPREGLWVKPVPSLLGALAAFHVGMSRRPRLAGLPSELEKIVGKAEVIQRGESFEEHRRDMPTTKAPRPSSSGPQPRDKFPRTANSRTAEGAPASPGGPARALRG